MVVRVYMFAALCAGVLGLILFAIPSTILSLPDIWWFGLALTLLIADLLFNWTWSSGSGLHRGVAQNQNPPA